MSDLKQLITAHAGGDVETVLAGTPWVTANRVYSLLEAEGNQGFKSLFKTAMQQAATAHVLTLLVEELEGALDLLVQFEGSLAHQEDREQVDRAMEAVAMLKQATPKTEVSHG